VNNFLVNLVCGLIAYCHQEQKPAIKLPPENLALLTDDSQDNDDPGLVIPNSGF